MTSIVSIDIETTGLDPQKDAIIEIGAVRFNGQRVEDEWSTLINPGRHIPENITQLTGIDDAMVRHAPRLADVIEELEAFVGTSPVLGQNVRFDLGFLQKQRILTLNPVVDTYELASVLLPTASRYNLGALGQLLAIPLPATHRALDDARVTHAVYERLMAQARELPLDLLAELVRLGEPLDWDGNFAFLEALRLRAREQAKGKRVQPQEDDGPLFEEPEKGRKGPPPGAIKNIVELDPEEVASVLEYGGPFSRYFNAYEQRPEQVEMLKAVTKALSYGNHLMVEAGTGVGKCLTADAWVTFSNGERKQIGEIVNANVLPAMPILSVDAKGKLIYQRIQAMHRNGVRPVWRLKTGLGHKITATDNHPFLTVNGWKALGELKPGDRIAVARHLPAGDVSYPEHETFVAGAMLGDGGCTQPDSLSFTNFDPQVVETIGLLVVKLGNVAMTSRKAMDSPDLVEMATSDIYWDRVVAIEPAGEAETFDLSMDGEPNFVANDIIVHNSFAYLVPAALFATQNNTRVVISTNTIALQDQLIRKDVPDLRAALGLDFRATVLKGRSNYLCPRRLEGMRHHGGPANADEMRVLAKVLVWRLQSTSGDRNELNLNRPQEKDVWMKFSAEDEACSGETCATRMGGVCPFYRAKQAAQNAHILIVNHALLLSDVATGSKVLPEYQYLIVDEAHHLESATTGALSFRMSQNDFERMLREVGGTNSGVLGRLLTETRDVLRPSDYARFTQMVHRASELSFRLDSQAKDFFYGLSEFMAFQREGRPQSLYAYQERIQPHTRTARGWENVEVSWGSAGDTMNLLVNVIGEIYKGVSELYNDGAEELEDPLGSLSNLYRRLSEAEVAIGTMIHEPTNDLVYWIEVQPQSKRLTLNHAPLRVGPLIQQYLWHEKDCVILTSATLTAAGDFTYLKNTLMAEEADELMLGSPYDYESSTLLFLTNDIPEPNAPGYENAVNKGLIQLSRASDGRMLVLFTSYAQLKRTSQAITGALAQDDIQVFEQGEGASPQALLEAFKSTERAVLLGTRSFWEGVDVPGDILSVVVITKLPFEVPSDPLIAARSETFEDPFGQYQIPEAILKFRQGFGRLIRTSSDRGVVAIFDRRLLTKMYGRLFIESLPQCTLRQGTINELSKLTGKWLQ